MTNLPIRCWVPQSKDSNLYELSFMEHYEDTSEGRKMYQEDLQNYMLKFKLEQYEPADELHGPSPPTTKIDEWTVQLPYNNVTNPKNFFKAKDLTILYKIERQTSETLNEYLIRAEQHRAETRLNLSS